MTDPSVKAVRLGIEKFGWSPLWVTFHSECEEAGVMLKICHATVSTPEMEVFDAVIITGGGMMNCCKISTFPLLNDAIAFHVGKLVLEGNYQIVAKGDG